MSRENSALIALEELKNLEARRVQQGIDEVKAKEDAERRAKEDAERRRREEEERMRREEEERMRLEQEERDRREREERIRIAEADVRSRAEQEARLREEQMRLDAQVKMAERKKTPYWLYITAGVLAVGLIGGGIFFYQKRQEADAENQRIAAELKQKEQEIKDLESKAAELEAEQAAAELKQKELQALYDGASSEAEKAKIQGEINKQKAEQERLAQELAANKTKRGGGGGGGGTAKKDPVTKERKDKINLVGGDGPL
jgi:DNA repair exonuclease SbcCD ATPase subunit